MNRNTFLEQVQNTSTIWDIIVIGGGATGLGIAVDAALRGYTTLLLEQSDFAKGTSSKSTKLIHGGVRYLAQGQIRLVLEALHERGILLQNAPHLVKRQAFVIPSYSWWGGPFYTFGLKLYDLLAGNFSLGSSTYISRKKTIEALPGIQAAGLAGGTVYLDAQFDDARLAINLAQTAAENGACLLNYMPVTALLKDKAGKLIGLKTQDAETGQPYTVKGKAVINATGVLVDTILKLDNPAAKALVRPSQGVHVVLERSFLPGRHALLIPKTADGRVLFAVPWHNKLVVGTTDTLRDTPELEPQALEQEIDFILHTAGAYLTRAPQRKDVLSVFAGLRPLAAHNGNKQATKEIARSYKLLTASSGLLTITGGKWTTYRRMAEDTVNAAGKLAGLPAIPCTTRQHRIHGSSTTPAGILPQHLALYGADAPAIQQLTQEQPELAQLLHPNYGYTLAEVAWAARAEMARTVEDVLARRVRLLFLDARAALEAAPAVAALLATEMHKDLAWQQEQLSAFTSLAGRYLPTQQP